LDKEVTREKIREDKVRRQLSTSQGERPLKKANLLLLDFQLPEQ
jgi:hypothetical protein